MVKKHYGIRNKKFKLIHFYDDINEWEFYDLEKDPSEMKNLYGNPSFSAEIEKMKSDLKNLIVQYDDNVALELFNNSKN